MLSQVCPLGPCTVAALCPYAVQLTVQERRPPFSLEGLPASLAADLRPSSGIHLSALDAIDQPWARGNRAGARRGEACLCAWLPLTRSGHSTRPRTTPPTKSRRTPPKLPSRAGARQTTRPAAPSAARPLRRLPPVAPRPCPPVAAEAFRRPPAASPSPQSCPPSAAGALQRPPSAPPAPLRILCG